ncbi:MAG: hypothetical protein IPL61_35235 [Myxococcales bacterium]|nr:hypothetical protein [Myxococcales bacterium]
MASRGPVLSLLSVLALVGACRHGPAPIAPTASTDLDAGGGPAGASSAEPEAAEPAIAELVIAQSLDGGRTDLHGTIAGASPAELALVIVRLGGPGDYPLGFAWDRGATRATVTTAAGVRCMTGADDAGAIRITAGPTDGRLTPGARLEGTYEIRCYPEADPERGAATTYAGRFVGALATP